MLLFKRKGRRNRNKEKKETSSKNDKSSKKKKKDLKRSSSLSSWASSASCSDTRSTVTSYADSVLVGTHRPLHHDEQETSLPTRTSTTTTTTRSVSFSKVFISTIESPTKESLAATWYSADELEEILNEARLAVRLHRSGDIAAAEDDERNHPPIRGLEWLMPAFDEIGSVASRSRQAVLAEQTRPITQVQSRKVPKLPARVASAYSIYTQASRMQARMLGLADELAIYYEEQGSQQQPQREEAGEVQLDTAESSSSVVGEEEEDASSVLSTPTLEELEMLDDSSFNTAIEEDGDDIIEAVKMMEEAARRQSVDEISISVQDLICQPLLQEHHVQEEEDETSFHEEEISNSTTHTEGSSSSSSMSPLPIKPETDTEQLLEQEIPAIPAAPFSASIVLKDRALPSLPEGQPYAPAAEQQQEEEEAVALQQQQQQEEEENTTHVCTCPHCTQVRENASRSTWDRRAVLLFIWNLLSFQGLNLVFLLCLLVDECIRLPEGPVVVG